jgi:predicted transposase/invertase (TIGR01784 family)
MKIEAEEAAANAARKVEDEFREDERLKTGREIAKNLINMNFPDEQITQATGLDIEEVKKLRKHK